VADVDYEHDLLWKLFAAPRAVSSAFVLVLSKAVLVIAIDSDAVFVSQKFPPI
jgi:hypothetical protein